MSSRPSPLPNRVTPFGGIIAHDARGLMMGNRGGKIHDGWRIARKQASRRWIICVTCFKGRRRRVMQSGYTELFFLDEATALAAGHRPCFECRRAAAKAFAAAMGETRADDIDRRLAAERLRPIPFQDRDRIDGVMVAENAPPAPSAPPSPLWGGAGGGVRANAFLHWTGRFLRWTPEGYEPATPEGPLLRLTPASTIAALRAGYPVSVHPSAN